MNIDNHPCFNRKAHKSFGRVHLPVAPRCNIQCKFCNRKFDCVNESRPGVSSGILSPVQAMAYLEEVFKIKKNISVVGIAGPGDPFANPEETMETLRLVRQAYPEMMLCVATNGLNLLPYVEELAQLNVTHVTVTVNAIDPKIGAKVYSWIRPGKRVMRAEQGAAILLENQLESIKKLKEHGVTVKVNSIILPGINEDHIEAIAEKMAEMGVDILNCVPYYPNEGAAFADMPEPSTEMVNEIRDKAGKHVKQMRHCKRCRADAVGLLGEMPDTALMQKLQDCETGESSCMSSATCNDAPIRIAPGITNPEIKKTPSNKPNIAVASMEGVLVNQHLGEAAALLIYGKKDGAISLLEARRTPSAGLGLKRWEELADTISDCGTLLVSGVGENPRRVLAENGIEIKEIEGLIDEAVQAIFDGKPINHMKKHQLKACGQGCSGDAIGCS